MAARESRNEVLDHPRPDCARGVEVRGVDRSWSLLEDGDCWKLKSVSGRDEVVVGKMEQS